LEEVVEMDWIRKAVGVPTYSSPKSSTTAKRIEEAQKVNYDDALAQEIRETRMDLTSTQQALADVNEDVAEATRARDRKRLAGLVEEKMKLEADVTRLTASLRNLDTQRQATRTASANFNQGILVKKGAAQLEELTAATEQLNIEEDVDRFRDAASVMQEQSRTLTTSLLDPMDLQIDAGGVTIDNEVERLLQAQDDAELAGKFDLPR
jgi:hypothetical protein